MPVARNHHYVPKCYLKGFSVERRKTRQIQVFDRISGAQYVTATDNVGSERDFNAVRIEGFPTDALESSYAQIETKIADALGRTIQAGTMTADEDRTYILNLIGLLALRNPRMRETLRDFKERVLKLTAQNSLSTPGRWDALVKRAKADGVDLGSALDYEQLKQFADKGEYTIQMDREDHIRREIETLDVILPYLFKRKWTMLRAPTGSGGFVTSDHPVCLIWASGKGGALIPPGYAVAGTQVIFPVSSQLAMIGTFEGRGAAVETTEASVAAINGAVIRFAQRQVFARDRNFMYVMGRDMQPRKASRLTGDRQFRVGPGEAASEVD